MRLKQQRRMGLLFMGLGASIILINLLVNAEMAPDGEVSGFLSGLGAAFFAIGVARLVRYFRIARDPDRASDYEASFTDERTAFVANRARSVTFWLSIYGEMLACLFALFVLHEQLLGQVLCALACIQCIVYTVLFQYYSKKY